MNHMTYRGYAARKDFDTDDEIIVGRVIDIDDIISFHGSCLAAFEAAFNAAVDSYLLASKRPGQVADRHRQHPFLDLLIAPFT